MMNLDKIEAILSIVASLFSILGIGGVSKWKMFKDPDTGKVTFMRFYVSIGIIFWIVLFILSLVMHIMGDNAAERLGYSFVLALMWPFTFLVLLSKIK